MAKRYALYHAFRGLSRSLPAALLFFSVGQSEAQSLHHQRLAIGLGSASEGILSDRGHAAFLAATLDDPYYDPWIGGRPFAEHLLVGERSCELYSIDSSGKLLWSLWLETPGEFRRVYHDLTDLSTAVGSSTRGRGVGFLPGSDTPVWHDTRKLYVGTTPYSDGILGTGDTVLGSAVMDGAGNIAWSGSGPATEGYRDVFYNTTNLSAAVLGSQRFAGPIATLAGRTAWFGRGSTTGQHTDAFLNTTNVSRPVLGSGPREAFPKAVSALGKLLWSGWGDSTFGSWDVFGDQKNLSMPILGQGADRSAEPIAMNPAGTILWIGQSFQATGGHPVLYLESTDYSRPVLGSGADVSALGLTDTGLPIWAGTGTGTLGLRNVFRGTVNVTRSAYAGQSRFSFLMATNRRGQILWRAEEPDDTVTVWLTSPSVPTTLTGTVRLENVSTPRERSIVIEFLEPATGDVLSSVQADLSANGTCSVEPSITGLLDIRVRVPHFLSRVARAVPVIETGSFEVTLANGDATLDNVVDLSDVSAVLVRFATAGNGDPVDLNEDGTVDLQDLAIALVSFAKRGE